jgi:hypothetical protein
MLYKIHLQSYSTSHQEGKESILPRTSKIAPGQRQDWLQRSEQGESIEKIAKDAGRDVRTVREHIEKAHLERDFNVARRDQLRDALQFHQKDMLALLERLRQTVHTPDLEYTDITGLDFGLEDLSGLSDLARNPEVGVGPALPIPGSAASDYELAPAIKVICDASGPQEIKITAEDSRLWRALKEHIGKDPLWRHIANWKNALLEEFQGRSNLNRAIRKKAEEVFALRVSLRPAPQTPRLTPVIVWWLRARLTNLALGNHVPGVEEDVRDTSTGGLETRRGQTLIDALGDTSKGKEQLQNTIAAMAGCAEVKAAAQTYRDVEDKTKRVHDALEEYLLIHHIPGRCGLCKKLGANGLPGGIHLHLHSDI